MNKTIIATAFAALLIVTAISTGLAQTQDKEINCECSNCLNPSCAALKGEVCDCTTQVNSGCGPDCAGNCYNADCKAKTFRTCGCGE